VCGLCGLDDAETDFTVRFHVHHITYDHVGYELDTDLVLLCAPCHNLIHYPKSPGAQHWVRFHADTIPNLAMLATDLDPFA
jgi:predicted HNH restriction endonuclease